jgi:hypothetical protein
LQQDDKWGNPKTQTGSQEIAHRNGVLALHVSFGQKRYVLKGANVFRFAPERGPPICALNEYTR